ncbi:unnamed protein product, partial [Iphiclides podalirius]
MLFKENKQRSQPDRVASLNNKNLAMGYIMFYNCLKRGSSAPSGGESPRRAHSLGPSADRHTRALDSGAVSNRTQLGRWTVPCAGKMSGSAQNEEGGKEDGGEAGRDMYRPKSVSTVVRVLTVFAYLFSVSLAAILLSVYYVCVWKSPELPPLENARIGISARRGEQHEYLQNFTEHGAFDYLGARGCARLGRVGLAVPPPDRVTTRNNFPVTTDVPPKN